MQKETLLNNYVELFAFICTKKEIEQDKLKVLEVKAKCLYAKTNPKEALDLQMEIQASKAFLIRCDQLCMELGEKYKNFALSLSNANCVLFSALFFEGKTPKQISLEMDVSLDHVYKKKCEFTKLLSERLKGCDISKQLEDFTPNNEKTEIKTN